MPSPTPTPSGRTTPNGQRKSSPAITVWHDRIRTGIFAESLNAAAAAASSNGHESSVTVVDDGGATLRSHQSIMGDHRGTPNDMLSIMSIDNHHNSRPSHGVDSLNHVIQLREGIISSVAVLSGSPSLFSLSKINECFLAD
jgi:hypothetical protein